MVKHKLPLIQELSENYWNKDHDSLPEEHETIDTGLHPHQGATELEIHRHPKGFTVVTPSGVEGINEEAYKHRGTPSPESIRDAYLRMVYNDSGHWEGPDIKTLLKKKDNKEQKAEGGIVTHHRSDKPHRRSKGHG